MPCRSCEGLQLYVDHIAQIEMSKEKRGVESSKLAAGKRLQRLEVCRIDELERSALLLVS